MAEQPKYNLTKFRELIVEAFDDKELRIFCCDHFREVADTFALDTGKRDIAFRLVEYCFRREALQVLEEKVKTERPGKYEKYQAQLKTSGDASTSLMEDVRAAANAQRELFETTNSESSRKYAPAMYLSPQLFLCYARTDQEKVESLYERLSSAGFRSWMDKKDILPGEQWKSSIQKAIRRSDFVLVCLSSNSVNRRGFIQKEIKDALDVWQEKLDSDIYLIPVRLEQCDVPEILQDFQWVDLFEEAGWIQLVKAIRIGMERQSAAKKPTD